ncbi:RNA-binding ribosome biosynthesis protein mak21 [Lithohypha guttulata]|uniref:RNA-binding ribosome biosynthesis protein mak21 n=1 Tax=Lithohypha guttulata TaxID=1690604 RepID=A0AAN7SZD7_9EURO|nr:RNA-binding ribosome biosynthesis protein mak21 [Lithohypha guttulata]
MAEDSKFENLRQKIEGNLKKSESRTKVKSKKSESAEDTKKNLATDNVRGKKRGRDGEVKNEKPPGQPISKTSKKAQDATGPVKGKDEVDLKAIVAELGGTQEDLDLIDGIQSDSELEGLESQPKSTAQPDSKKGKTLESGMANILKEIALVRDTYADSENEADSEEDTASKVNGDKTSARSQADHKEDDSIKFKSAATEIQQQKGKKIKLHCTPRPDWFMIEIPEIDESQKPKFDVSTQSIDRLRSHARSLLQVENEAFKGSHASSSSQSFYNTVISSGTLSDKISALTLAVQESPLHNMRAFETLLNLARKRSRSQAVDVLRALKDLFAQGSMLPSDRRLYTFSTQPGLIAILGQMKSWQSGEPLPNGLKEAHLIVWAFEDWLKEQYFEVLKVLETWCNDEIEFAKTRATSYVYELLKEKPEQESNLLRLLLNKLGDPVKKIASQASYLIMQLLAAHPAMKDVVISAIDTDFIFKPNQSTHARYYAAVTLNQTALSVNEERIAIKLLDIYFGLFKLLLKPGEEQKKPVKVSSTHKRQREQAEALADGEQENDLREKLISAVLTGVNRAYPYAGADHKRFNEQVETLFQITHSANFNTSIQAMLLIQQLTAATSASTDRFYRVLYESLLDPRLLASSKQQLYLNLLHRSLKADLNQKRVKAFAKRILQILSLQDPSFVCAAFFLLKDLEKTFPSLTAMLDQPEEHEDDEEVFRDADAEPPPQASSTTTTNDTIIYDAVKRDPAYANADRSCLWDVIPYLAHYHPSITVSADHILDRKPLPGKPDLSIHTLVHFLDRFVYKNAKLSDTPKLRGSSIMQPMAHEDSKAVLVGATSARSRNLLPVNSAEFLAKKEEDIPAEDVFFHQYFKTLGKSANKQVKKAAKKRAELEEDGTVASDDNEDEVWQAMLNNAPDLEGLGADEDDEFSDMDGFEDEMMDDDEDDEEEADIDTAMQLQDNDSNEEGSVDIEAGIFDDSDDDEQLIDTGAAKALDEDEDDDSDFGGLSSENEAKATKKPSKKTLQKREGRERKKKLKALPTFASAADWAKELDDDKDEDLG